MRKPVKVKVKVHSRARVRKNLARHVGDGKRRGTREENADEDFVDAPAAASPATSANISRSEKD